MNFICSIQIFLWSRIQVSYEANGWVAHHVSDIWGKTSPGQGQAVWAVWPMGGAWLCTHLWEHYTYTLDKVSSGFWVNYLTFDLKVLTKSDLVKRSVYGDSTILDLLIYLLLFSWHNSILDLKYWKMLFMFML